MRRTNGIGQLTRDSNKPARCFFYRHILLVAGLFFSIGIFAQEESGWMLKQEYNGINVSVQTDEYHDIANGLHYEYVLLKLKNTTGVSKKVELIPVLYYDGKKLHQGDIGGSVFYLAPGETRTGSSDAKSPDGLRIFSRFLNYDNKPVLNAYELIINTEDL